MRRLCSIFRAFYCLGMGYKKVSSSDFWPPLPLLCSQVRGKHNKNDESAFLKNPLSEKKLICLRAHTAFGILLRSNGFVFLGHTAKEYLQAQSSGTLILDICKRKRQMVWIGGLTNSMSFVWYCNPIFCHPFFDVPKTFQLERSEKWRLENEFPSLMMWELPNWPSVLNDCLSVNNERQIRFASQSTAFSLCLYHHSQRPMLRVIALRSVAVCD